MTIWRTSSILRHLGISVAAVCSLMMCSSDEPLDGKQSGVDRSPSLQSVKLPEGFTISEYATDLDGARSMTMGRNGTLFVGTRSDRVYALVDTNRDGRSDKRYIVSDDLNTPNGVAFRNGALYVAEVNRVLRFDSIEQRLVSPPAPVVVNDDFPTERSHGWKFIRFGPDDKLYVPVGAPCNVCESQDERFASIMRMNPDGSGLELYASGVRNTVGFDWQPNTNVLWFTDNGRDWLGDDLPPDELNRAPRKGMHFGFPYCHGNGIKDPDHAGNRQCSDFTPPAITLDAHVAALGMRFYTGSMFPEEYRGGIFIAEHGSWNRSSPIGYRITFVKVNGDNAIRREVFASGFLQRDKVWGRPVDVEVMPDGSLLVSDDHGDAIYRVTYGK